MRDIAFEALKAVGIVVFFVLIGPAFMLVLFIDLWLIHLMGVG